jgi:hypothetical protein
MADQADVETALAGIVGGVLYPNGTLQPCAVPGVVCRVFRGWPTPAALEADLAAGRVNVSIRAAAGSTRVTTRYSDEWSIPQPTQPTLSAVVQDTTVIFSGDAKAGQLAALLVDGRAVVHRTRDGDTPTGVAASLTAQLRQLGTSPWDSASASGATVAVPGARQVIARIVADQTAIRETRRQRQNFTVTCWCPDPATRDAVGSIIDAVLSAVDFLALGDGTSGRLRFVDSVMTDRWEDLTLYRRDLTYSVDYATTITTVLPCLVVQGTEVSPNGQPPIANFLS